MFCPTTPILKYSIIPVIKQLIRNLIRNHEKKTEFYLCNEALHSYK